MPRTSRVRQALDSSQQVFPVLLRGIELRGQARQVGVGTREVPLYREQSGNAFEAMRRADRDRGSQRMPDQSYGADRRLTVDLRHKPRGELVEVTYRTTAKHRGPVWSYQLECARQLRFEDRFEPFARVPESVNEPEGRSPHGPALRRRGAPQ